MDLFMGVKWCDLAKKDENSFNQKAIHELLSNLYKMNMEWFYFCKVSVKPLFRSLLKKIIKMEVQTIDLPTLA